ncbi:uncharacterized protein LOC115760888 isoform X1 [Drosophila novamexicana]|uniref:uncharacterized protein LOC115760888 isoform X1 n=1 Tax=Drosophila novamexicana TaxID=47314 RepID=UPI0011E5A0F3|nr:uncharacterized protein LOC115760888 isoform X1 [Drosophila novamexicana]
MRGKLEQQPAGIRLPCSVRIWNPATPPAHAWTGRKEFPHSLAHLHACREYLYYYWTQVWAVRSAQTKYLATKRLQITQLRIWYEKIKKNKLSKNKKINVPGCLLRLTMRPTN